MGFERIRQSEKDLEEDDKATFLHSKDDVSIADSSVGRAALSALLTEANKTLHNGKQISLRKPSVNAKKDAKKARMNRPSFDIKMISFRCLVFMQLI